MLILALGLPCVPCWSRLGFDGQFFGGDVRLTFGAGASLAYPSAWPLAVGAPLLAEVAGLAVGAEVDGAL